MHSRHLLLSAQYPTALISLSTCMNAMDASLIPSAERLALTVALAIGMVVVGAMVFAEVMERAGRQQR